VRKRLITAAASAVPAAAVSVLVNVWTTGWAWPAGVAVGVLVLAQVVVTFWTGAPDTGRSSVTQRLGDVVKSDVVGARLDSEVARGVTVDQSAHKVEDSRLTGLEIGLKRDSDKN